MNKFNLQIVTPDGLFFDGQAEKIVVTTVEGDVGILANHANYLAPIGIGKAKVTVDGNTREAACTGGMLTVTDDVTRIVASTFEWADEIDVERAKRAAEKAQARLDKKADDADIKLAQLKLKRALNRIKIYEQK